MGQDPLLIGLVEGLTEFLPVSSTGHMILVIDLLKLHAPPGHVLEIVIQLGAILAVVAVYWRRFIDILRQWRSRNSQIFVRNILLAFLPAMVIGALAHDAIKSVLFSPLVVAWALLIGGIAILVIERFKPPAVIAATEQMSARTALGIGFMQCLAMIPGVSRSGATIMGALLMGVDRPLAAEFSFFLAVPTMTAATIYDLYKSRDTLDIAALDEIAIGFVTAFVVALVVVRWLIGFVQHHGFAPFAWYRIALGLTMLGLMASA